MNLGRFIRIALAIVTGLLFVIALASLLFVTESALNVWQKLLDGPRVVLYGYVLLILGLAVIAARLIWSILRRPGPAPVEKAAEPLTQGAIEERLATADKAGVDVSMAQEELQELAARQAAGSIHLCFFGEISTGKSSLIKSLVPSASVAVDVVGGSTTDVRHYRWRNEAGHEILLTDVPGTGGLEDGLDDIALQEARRAHVVLFVCDGDLSRQEHDAVRRLSELGKPVVIVLNKADRYSREEQAELLQTPARASGRQWQRDRARSRGRSFCGWRNRGARTLRGRYGVDGPPPPAR